MEKMDPRGTYHDVIERNKIWFGFAVDFFGPNVNDNLNIPREFLWVVNYPKRPFWVRD